jgi:hypothetical protein
MSGTGFYDRNTQVYMPLDGVTWGTLADSPYTKTTWGSWTTWYNNLTAGVSTVSFTGDIIDLTAAFKVSPEVTLDIKKDTGAAATFVTDAYPEITFEASNNADMSSATTQVITRASPEYTIGDAKRYHRITVKVEAGSNASPQGLVGYEVNLNNSGGSTAEYVSKNGGLPTTAMDINGNMIRTT